jgi:pimeloyl-ACP methyl ester carboxylesterase
VAVIALTSVTCTATPQLPTEREVLLGGRPMSACVWRGNQAFCGTSRVPEDREDPGGRSVDLNIVVIPAERPRPEPDPVFFLAGGPGGAATDSWGTAPSVFPEIHATRDIVLMDQRGTGGSGRLLGPRIPEIRPGSSVADVRAAVSSWMRRALAANVADPWNFTSDEAADDIDDVRAALGYDSIDLYGGSYGATLALYYLRRHPEHTRAVVLDGGTLLHVPIFELIAGRSQEALDLVLERCAAEPSCRGSFPDLADRFGDVMRRLTRHPVATSARDPWSGEEVVVSADAFGELIHSLLVTSRAGDVPRTIRLAVDGEMDAVGQMIATVPTDPDDLRLLMSWAIRCSEPWAEYDFADVRRRGGRSYLLRSQLEEARTLEIVCESIPATEGPEEVVDPVRSEVPVLLLNGTADPQDPPSNVADAPELLPNSLVIEVNGYGHTVGQFGCLPSVVTAFFEAGSVEHLDTRCVDLMPAPPFMFP